jgi:hypothetical protein
LPSALRVRVGSVVVDGADVLLALLPRSDDGPSAAEVRLGPMTEVRAKGIAALAVLHALQTNVGYIDVRVPEAPTTPAPT